MNLKSVKIIAVDFDGTLCENSWPEIGEPNEELIEYLRNRKKDGDKLILWTCRVEDMLQKAVEWLLKELGERHFEILWRYESATNSIVIQMDKRDCHQRHRLVRKVMFDDFRRIRSNQFEFVIVQFLKDMAQELEYQIKVAAEPMKGEDND